MTERVTRSRSRSLMRETPSAPAPVSRLPRLDIQSEDDEEADAVVDNTVVINTDHDRDTEIRSWTSFTPPKVSRETKTVAVATLVLLLLIVVSSKVVEAVNTDKSVQDAVIMVLAYALTPVRITVETLRLIGGAVAGSNQSQRSISPGRETLDYEALVNMIVNSEKFIAIVEKISSETVNSYSSRIQEQIVKESAGYTSKRQSDIDQIESDLSQAKQEIQNNMQEALNNIRTQVDNKNVLHENSQKEMMIQLEKQIEVVNKKISEVSAQASESQDSEVFDQELKQMKDQLRMLEEERKMTEAEIQKCCRTNANVDLVIENKVTDLMKQLQVNIANNYVTEQEVNDKLSELETKTKEILSTYSSESKEETKLDIETLVNKKIDELRKSVEVEVTPVSTVVTSNVSDHVTKDVDVKKIVREALTKYDADKTGLFDFALESAGGSILTTKCTEPYQPSSAVMSVWGIPFWWDSNSPRTILQPGTSPGQCWAFRGSHGSVVVQLSSSIHITAVTIGNLILIISIS